MKMKILLCCFGMLWCALGILRAEEEPVILFVDKAAQARQDKRSLQVVPTASRDGRTIYIRTDWSCDRLYVEVEDAKGMTVFAGLPDSLGDAEYSLEIPGNGAGAYTLWVLVDETMYVGEFRVE